MKKIDKKQFLAGKRLREAYVIVLVAFAGLILLSILSYSDQDTAWSVATSENIQNLAGTAGAWIADILLTFLGITAYVIPPLILFLSFLLYKEENLGQRYLWAWVVRFSGLMVCIMATCAIIASVNPHSSYKYPGTIGGILGSLIAYLLVPYLHKIGTLIILSAVIMLSLTLSLGISWIKVARSLAVLSMHLGYLFAKYSALAANNILKYAKIGWTKINFIKDAQLRKFLVAPILQAPIEDAKNLQETDLEQFFMPENQTISEKKSSPICLKAEDLTREPTISPTPLESQSQQELNFKPKKSVKNTLSALKLNLNNSSDVLPTLALLQDSNNDPKVEHYSKAKLESISHDVEARLLDFGVKASVVAVLPGPIITRFELTLAPGVKASKISGLAKDLARSLSVTSVRVVEVIPGKPVVGLEIPNKKRELVRLHDILESNEYNNAASAITLALGKDIAGTPVVADLAKMPHLLVAGTTGSGKSVGINVMLASLLYKTTPAEVRLLLIDPKMLELAIYDGIPHLLTPVITDMADAANALKWCVGEMERRYQLMAAIGVRNLEGYNSKVKAAQKDKTPMLDPLWNPKVHPETTEHPELNILPQIVVIIDEFADMIMVVGKKVEELIARIAQKARASGIHMILATQRPSVDVITGLIKANVPTRIAFQVSSRIDSRTILDQQGAENLLGHGDMLYLPPGTGMPMRVHGAFVQDDEVHRIVNFIKENNSEPVYIEEIGVTSNLPFNYTEDSKSAESDELYDEAVNIVLESQKASISYLQRRLKIGYNRSARLIEDMEQAGLVSGMLPNGTREVVVNTKNED